MPDENSIDSFPEDAQRMIRELREEAARHRVGKQETSTRATEFEAKYTEAGDLLKAANEKLTSFDTLTEKHEKMLAESATLQDNYNRLQAASEFGISAHANRLQGNTLDELKADAESLSKTLGAGRLPKDPAAGSKPAATPSDALKEQLRNAFGRVS